MNDKLIKRRAILAAALSMAASGAAWGAPAATGGALQRPAQQLARPTQAVLLSVARAGQRLVAAGERGLVIVSDDGGRSWTQAQVPVSVTLTRLRFVDAREGWAVGHRGVVLHTRDAGSNWRRVLDGLDVAAIVAAGGDADEQPWLDLATGADGALLVVGAYGLALASGDAGRSWKLPQQELPNPDGFTYYGLAQRGEERFLFGEQGLLLRAAGAGAAFVATESPSTGSLFNAVTLREGPLLLLGLRGKVFRSAQAGAPWTALPTPVDASLLAGRQLDDGRVVLVGAAGQLLLSADQGQRFQALTLARRFPFADLTQAADGALLLVGTRGLLRLDAAELNAAAKAATHKNDNTKTSTS